MDYSECLERRLIRRSPDSKNWVEKEIKLAEKFLLQAQRIREIGVWEMVEVAAYTSSFHSARNLLFEKGYSEKSHYCLFIGLLELYQGNSEIVSLVSEGARLSKSRHEIVYGGKVVDKKEAEYALELAKRFLNAVKKG